MRPHTAILAIGLAALAAVPAAGDSLWRQGAAPHFHWLADTKARRVGDIVSIVINEESKASTDLSQSHSKETETNAVISEIRHLFGINKPSASATGADKGLPAVDVRGLLPDLGLPVVDAEGRPVGLLDVQDLVGLKAADDGQG